MFTLACCSTQVLPRLAYKLSHSRACNTIGPQTSGRAKKDDPDREYKLKSIIGETETHYLIEWENDEETGEVFEDSWEPKENANREAVADYEFQKAEKRSMLPFFYPISTN